MAQRKGIMKERLPIAGHGGTAGSEWSGRRRPRAALAIALVTLITALVGLTACGTEIKLRDDYMGKRFIQPSQVPGTVERNERGDPLVPETTRWRFPWLNPLRL